VGELKKVVEKVWWTKKEESSSRETVIVLFLQSHVCHVSFVMCHVSTFSGISVVTKNHC